MSYFYSLNDRFKIIKIKDVHLEVIFSSLLSVVILKICDCLNKIIFINGIFHR